MRDATFTLALAALLAIPSIASAQDRKEVRPTVDAPRTGEPVDDEMPDRGMALRGMTDREIAPIAEAIRRGEPVARIETNWKALVERHAEGMEESDADALTLRVLHAAWEPMEADLDDGLRDLEASDACVDEARAIERHRSALKGALAAGDGATERDVETATTSFAALSEALGACETTLAPKAAGTPRAIRPPGAADGAEAADAAETPGDDARHANVDLQNWLQNQQRTLTAMSNISKKAHETAMSIIQNMK